MKIEIELEYVESLKRHNKEKDKQIEQLEAQLKSFSRKQVDEDIALAAEELANAYLCKVFQLLGFDVKPGDTSLCFSDSHLANFRDPYTGRLKTRWHLMDNLHCDINYSISEGVKKAYLCMGVIPPVDLNNE